MSLFQAIIFGIIQGVTELFPVSSLGHSVLLPSVLHWNIRQDDPFFLTFLVATHTATAIVLFFFFFKDWKRIITGIFRSLQQREIRADDTDAKLGWLLVVTTIPAGVLGLLFEKPLQNLFAAPRLVAFVLILNGIMLFAAELLRHKRKEINAQEGSDQRIAKISWASGLKVGILQCIALIPGFSRTGSTITGGLLVGLSHEDSARFSFLLATPIIGAASLLKLPELISSGKIVNIETALVGAICAGGAAYLSVRFLTKYFQTNKLWPFALYCLLMGILVSAIIALRG